MKTEITKNMKTKIAEINYGLESTVNAHLDSLPPSKRPHIEGEQVHRIDYSSRAYYEATMASGRMALAHIDQVRQWLKINPEQDNMIVEDVAGSPYFVHRIYYSHGQCNGLVRLTDSVTGKVYRESNATLARHFRTV
jgi:hypothetical protein